MAAIEKGTIKVVWASSDGKHIYSKMFEDIKDAERFGKKKKDYLIFQLVTHKHFNEFTWKVLPYGQHELYTTFLSYYHAGHIQKLLRFAKTL